VAAHNVCAAIRGGNKKPFVFATLGLLAAIGRRSGVANIMGVNISGFAAWFLWRTIYLSKLPGLEKKIRVALDWTLDLIFSKNLVIFWTCVPRLLLTFLMRKKRPTNCLSFRRAKLFKTLRQELRRFKDGFKARVRT
jgi:hypothetical protein